MIIGNPWNSTKQKVVGFQADMNDWMSDYKYLQGGNVQLNFSAIFVTMEISSRHG